MVSVVSVLSGHVVFTAVGACAPLVCVDYGSNTGLTYQSLYRNCGPSSKFRYTSVRATGRRGDRYERQGLTRQPSRLLS